MWSVPSERMPAKKKADKSVEVRVTTMDAELEFSLDYKASGRDLFDLVSRTVGLREIWYFGLQFMTEKGYYDWLAFDKKVVAQGIKKAENGFHFFFLVKYYPEDVSEELIQDITQHYFYLQVKQFLVNMDIYCPPEASVLLASYAIQAKFGDFDDSIYKPGMLLIDELLPQRVIDQYQMTPDMWEDRIKTWWMNNKGMTREEAELEYLRIAQDLDMYGIHYFPICNKNESDLWLGATALGINIYDEKNKLSPKASFAWSEIKNISFKEKKFVIQTSDKSSCNLVTFWSQNAAVNKVILDLCIGSHNLYLRRRQPDSLEMQQMKSQAKEERLKRQNDRHRYEREQQLRAQAEREKERLQQDVFQLNEQLFAAQEALRRSEETSDLLAEKARIAEDEALSLAERASAAEAEIQRIRISALKTEEAKILMERKAREAELIASRMVEESEKRTKEAEKLKEDLVKAKHAEKTAKDKLFELMGNSYMPMLTGYDLSNPMAYNAAAYGHPAANFGRPYPFASDTLAERDLRSLSAEIEKERAEYLQKSKHLQEQLSDLRTEIDGLKLEDRQTDIDRLYQETLTQGDDKYSTLRKSGAGSTKARVALFDDRRRMPYPKRRVEKLLSQSSDGKSDAPAAAPTSTPAPESITIGLTEFFALEDSLAEQSSAEDGVKQYLETSESLLAALAKYRKEAAAQPEGVSESIDESQLDFMMTGMRLRRLNRLAQFRIKRIRDRVAEERQKVEQQYLQLQNLLYEVSHIEKEVEKCLEFKSDHEDIEMIPVEQFYQEAPESISKLAATKDDPHAQRLARLNWELETRKQLETELEKLQTKKAELSKQIGSTEGQLNTMQPKLETLLEASRPLQDALDMPYEKEAMQRQYASYLPACLYHLYIQALAYKEVIDRQFGVSIEGDVDRVKKLLEKRNRAINNDDDESTDSESDGEEATKQGGQHHGPAKTGHQRRKTITEVAQEHASNALDPFPLHVELKTTYKGKATIYLKFFYIEYLGVIGVKSRLELLADFPRAVASASNLLSDETILAYLYASDSGLSCPNPTGSMKLKYTNLDLISKLDVFGRLYGWAQRVGGLVFPSTKDASIRDEENEDGFDEKSPRGSREDGAAADPTEQRIESEDGCQFFQTVLRRIRKRILARLLLQEQFSTFEALNVYPPKEVSTWFPSRIHTRMTQWTSMTHEDFMCHPASRGFRECVNEEGWFFKIVMERDPATLTALIYVPVDYPSSSPVFCPLLKKKGIEFNVERCRDVWHFAHAVNLECVRRIPKSVSNYALSIQLQFLASRLDVVLEIQSSEQGNKDFPLEHLFQTFRKNQDRQFPFWYNEKRNCYSFDHQ